MNDEYTKDNTPLERIVEGMMQLNRCQHEFCNYVLKLNSIKAEIIRLEDKLLSMQNDKLGYMMYSDKINQTIKSSNELKEEIETLLNIVCRNEIQEE